MKFIFVFVFHKFTASIWMNEAHHAANEEDEPKCSVHSHELVAVWTGTF